MALSFGSNRRFGLVLVTVCAVGFALANWHGARGQTVWLVATATLLLITMTLPRLLDPLKRQWLKIGGFLHVIVSPVLLTVFYYAAVVPLGLLTQLFGHDPLRRKINGPSYWVERKPPGPEPKTMTELF